MLAAQAFKRSIPSSDSALVAAWEKDGTTSHDRQRADATKCHGGHCADEGRHGAAAKLADLVEAPTKTALIALTLPRM
jgi:hypothetical protein